ncbi:MAG: type II toxin-antitoxin system HicA family toxin [Calditrichota bacterium]
MPKLPVLSGEDLIRALTKGGFIKVRQKGSHVSMCKGRFRTVIPLHQDLSPGTLLGILRQAGLTKEDLRRLLEL